jgi:hypothetical protein
MINIIDNFLEDEHYTRLTEEHLEYGRVHWFGRKSKPRNALHELIHKTIPLAGGRVTGATAWYNIRPINPQWHNDIDSYCTQNGVAYYPSRQPQHTYIYYVKSPESGGELELLEDKKPDSRQEQGNKYVIEPLQNRLLSFPCNIPHRVKEYKGNRVSIGIIWWFDVPVIYGKLGVQDIKTLSRVWELEDAEKIKKG